MNKGKLDLLTEVQTLRQRVAELERQLAAGQEQHAPERAVSADETRLLEQLNVLAQTIGTARELHIIFRALFEFLRSFTPAEAILVSLFDPLRQLRTCVYSARTDAEDDVSQLPPLPMTGSPHSQAIASGEILITTDFQAAVAGLPVVNLGLDQDPRLPRSSLAAPMRVKGRIIGGFEVQSLEPAAYGEQHIPVMRMAASLCAIAVENVLLVEREQQLRIEAQTSEARFRGLVQNSSDIFLVIGPDRGIRYVSPSIERLFGYTPESVLGQDVLSYLHPDDCPAALASLASSAAEPGTHPPAEFRVRQASGAWRYLEVVTTNMLADPSVGGLVINGRDTTERRQTEEALRRYAERLGTMREIERAILAAKSPEAIAHAALGRLQEMLAYLHAGVLLLEEGARPPLVVAADHDQPAEVYAQLAEVWPDALFGAGQSAVWYVEDLLALQQRPPVVEQLLERGVRCLLAAPLRVEEELIGLLYLTAAQPGAFDAEHADIAHEVADSLAIAIRQARLHEQVLRHAANLERRVAERTVALHSANSRLKHELVEHRRAQEALREHKETLQAVITASPDLITILELNGELRSISPAIQTLFGYRPAERQGRDVLELIHPEDQQPVIQAMQTVVAGVQDESQVRYRYRHATGHWVVVETRGRLMLNASGQPAGIVAVTRDITEHVRLEAALTQAKEEAEQANRAKSEFLSRMSHELRTPLNAILGFAQLLEFEELPAGQREYVHYILRGGRHLLGLINEVLDIARIEAGRLALSLEPVSLQEVLQECMELLQPLLAQHGVELQAEQVLAGQQQIVVDRQRFKQVLLNLLSNAIKYNRPGGSVSLSCAPIASSGLQIQVSDTGPGIAPDKLSRLFTPFDRLGAEQTEIEGTGLGLALSHHLVEAMGGSIGVESSVGQGSTFWVTVPQAEPPSLPARAATQQDPLAPAAGRQSCTVLTVDDNRSNLRLVERLLSRAGRLTVLTATQGQQALELARARRPDLILLDMHLPDLPGDEVLLRLRSEPETADIPVIMLSADAAPQQAERLLQAGAQAFLAKPLEVRRLLELVEELCVGRKA